MKNLNFISTIVILAFTHAVSAQNTCSSKITDLGYKCCSSDCVTSYIDEDGRWAFENGQWCGCGDDNNSKCSTKIIELGYSCCPSNCKVIYTDDDGTWGVNNNEWCGCHPTDTSDSDDEDGTGKEIERKWLIDLNKIPFSLDDDGVDVFEVEQDYICFDPEIRVRKYTYGTDYTGYQMTIKTNLTEDGLIRDETNIDINEEQYNNLYKKKEGNTINKTRYQMEYKGKVLAIDVFKGDLKGLVYMEIEFPNKKEAEAYSIPNWVITEVTRDIRYKNGHLARYGIPELDNYNNI